MRESLTVLAGLLVLALLAALIGPAFVDWRGYRPQIEARLTSALGVETKVAGGIGLRLLPSPRLMLGDVRIGSAGTDESGAFVERLTVELALAALARAEFRFADIQAEGATVSVVLDEAGAIRLPARMGPGLPAQASLDKVSIRRSALIWRDAGREPVSLAPIAAEISAVSLEGPWRVEGEVAGTSLRLATGVIEADGRLRSKATLTGQNLQLGFDGAFLLPAQGRAGLSLDGAFTLSPGGAVSVAGRAVGDGRKLDLSGLVLDFAGGAARLEGEGQFMPGSGGGALSLRARRLDADALVAALEERSGFSHALQGLPGPFDVTLDLDQLIWRGEDLSAFALRGRLDAGGLSEASASLRVAGALVGASGTATARGVAGRLNVKAEDARRVAFALSRAGLDPSLSELVGTLGRIDADAVGSWDEGRLGFERFVATGSSGLRVEGQGELTSERLAMKLSLHGLDLNVLPPGTSLAGLLGTRELALDLALTQARFRNAPPGSASLDLRREGATTWRLRRLAIDGFGGVSVSGAGALLAEGGEISGRIRAPRFETLAALAGPMMPETVRQGLSRLGEGLSRLDSGFRLTRAPSGVTGVFAEGTAQAGRLALDGRLDATGAWEGVNLRFDLSDRRQAFLALGLPSPQTSGPGRFMLEQTDGRLRGSLAGPGLSVVVEGERGAVPMLTLQADGAGQILPAGAARIVPDGVVDGHARAGFGPDALKLDDIVFNLAGASGRGALVLPREGPVTGRLVLQAIDLRMLLAPTLGGLPATAGQAWSSARFAPEASPGDLAIAIEAASLTATDGIVLRDARLTLQADRDGLKVEDLQGGYGGGRIAGRIATRREGGLAQVSGRLDLSGIDLAGASGGALGGRLFGRIEGGGSGESPARLIAALGGAGSLALSGVRIARFDPAAYARVIAGTGEDASESDMARLQDRFAAALDAASWEIGEVTVPFTVAGGLARLQPLVFERSGLRVEGSGTVDLRGLSADLRLGLRPLGALPKGWPGDAPQIAVAWRGPLSGLRRETDVGALSNTVAARALAREIERVEAFEADARERAAHSRRLRAERETRENERRLGEFLKAEEERRLAEEKRAEEQRRLEDVRRLAEEKKAEEARRAEQARQETEARRRAEAEERARAEAARAAQQQAPAGPLVLPGGTLPPLAPPLQIESVPRPLSRTAPPN